MQRIYIVDKEFHSVNFKKEDFLKGEYDACIFVNCNFNGIDLSHCNFVNCKFDSCDLSNQKMIHTTLQEIQFQDCKMIGIHFEDCNPFLLSFQFKGCNLNYSCFFKLKLNSTVFKTCSLQECDFSQSDLSKSKFQDCDLNSATFYQTNLENADLRSSYNIVLNPEENRLKNAKFSLETLPGLLTKYGISVD